MRNFGVIIKVAICGIFALGLTSCASNTPDPKLNTACVFLTNFQASVTTADKTEWAGSWAQDLLDANKALRYSTNDNSRSLKSEIKSIISAKPIDGYFWSLPNAEHALPKVIRLIQEYCYKE